MRPRHGCYRHAVDAPWQCPVFCPIAGDSSQDGATPGRNSPCQIYTAKQTSWPLECCPASVPHVRCCPEIRFRAYCATIGDNSQPSWSEAPEWQRTRAVNGVKFHLDNPSAKPSHSHESWLAEKEADGWKYGPVKDAEKKEHPCFVPYGELPDDQKAKDYLFKAICGGLYKYVDFYEKPASA